SRPTGRTFSGSWSWATRPSSSATPSGRASSGPEEPFRGGLGKPPRIPPRRGPGHRPRQAPARRGTPGTARAEAMPRGRLGGAGGTARLARDGWDVQELLHHDGVDPLAVEEPLLAVDAPLPEARAAVRRHPRRVERERREDELVVADRAGPGDERVQQP